MDDKTSVHMPPGTKVEKRMLGGRPRQCQKL
jgi:hypothetical protein